MLLFLNGAVCFCDHHATGEHGALEHLSAALERGSGAPDQGGHRDHAPDDDGCVQMDVLGLRERGVDADSSRHGSFPVAAVVQEPARTFELASGPTGGAEPPGIHAPPRFLTHCSLLC